MTELVWQDPPPRRKGTSSYAAEIEVLKANPGKWAVITTAWKTTSAPAALRQAGCETTTRRNPGPDQAWTVYARFPVAAPKVRADAGQAQTKVQQAVSRGTALTPAPAAARPPLPALKASGGYSQFLAKQRSGAATAPGK